MAKDAAARPDVELDRGDPMVDMIADLPDDVLQFDSDAGGKPAKRSKPARKGEEAARGKRAEKKAPERRAKAPPREVEEAEADDEDEDLDEAADEGEDADEDASEKPAKKRGQNEEDDADEDADDEGEEDEDADSEEDEETEADAEDEADDATDGDYLEVEAEDGSKERIPVETVLASHRKYTKLGGDLVKFQNQLQTAFNEKMNPVLEEQIKARDTWLEMAEEALKWSPVAPKPKLSLLDKNSDDYDPDAYNFQMRQHEESKGEYEAARAAVAKAKDKRDADNKAAAQAYVDREQASLKRAWPELFHPEKGEKIRAKVYEVLKSSYGLEPKDIDTIANHRFFLAARDLLKYHAMIASKGQKLTKATERAKLVKSTAKRTSTSVETRKRRSSGENLAKLKKSGTMEDAAAAIADLL